MIPTITEMTRRLYFDNAATSFPKPPRVCEAMLEYARDLGAPARGRYAEAAEASRLVQQCRERINALINGTSPDHIVFTLNTTDALNMAIKGVVSHSRMAGRRAHVVTTWMDHNSILRPLNALNEDGVCQTRIAPDPETDLIDPDAIRRAITPDTVLVATLHASNVTGAIQPVEEIGRICRERGVLFLLDAAQSLGHIPVNAAAINADLVAFPGHKGLLGPTGTGGLYIRPGVEALMRTTREGGTGSRSELDVQPRMMPDRFEPGSHNTMGIIGLSEGAAYLLERGIDSVRAHEERLIRIMLDRFGGEVRPSGPRLLGPRAAAGRVGVFSFVHETLSSIEIADALERRFGVLTRPGLHCAPLAHRSLNTSESGGAVRLSLGPFLSEEDVVYAADSLENVCGGVRVTQNNAPRQVAAKA
jgi:cysteine desulfurase / selenocysteine lyase